MKVFISADIEGVTGIVNWNETEKNHADWRYFADQMTKEVCAACEAAIEAGATEILVKDAHDSARNLNPASLPECVKINRGWSGHPYSMMDCIDKSFDAAIMIGYHNYAGSEGNPLSHTMNLSYQEMRLNGKPINEFMLNSLTANYEGVPVVFLSGDKSLCAFATEINQNIRTVTTNEGRGNSSTSISPTLAIKKIKAEVKEALHDDLNACRLVLPKTFTLEVSCKDHFHAYRASFYAGAEQISPTVIKYQAEDYFDILRFIQFGIS